MRRASKRASEIGTAASKTGRCLHHIMYGTAACMSGSLRQRFIPAPLRAAASAPPTGPTAWHRHSWCQRPIYLSALDTDSTDNTGHAPPPASRSARSPQPASATTYVSTRHTLQRESVCRLHAGRWLPPSPQRCRRASSRSPPSPAAFRSRRAQLPALPGGLRSCPPGSLRCQRSPSFKVLQSTNMLAQYPSTPARGKKEAQSSRSGGASV